MEMDNKVEKELQKLLKEQMEATVHLVFYTEQRTRLLMEYNALAEEIIAKSEEDKLLSDEEYEEKRTINLKDFYRYDAYRELLATLKHLDAKAKRRCNEIDKKIEAFCKRHGLEINNYSVMKKDK